MRSKRKRPLFPRSLIRNLGQDIEELARTNEGRLLALEIVDEIPLDLRPHVLEGLSAFYVPEIKDFFHIVHREYGKELAPVCSRALEKFNMAGMDVNPREEEEIEFFKAYATCTRHSGQVNLDVAWRHPDGLLDVECFFLSFNYDGVHGFFVISDMLEKDYETDRRLLPDMKAITQDEACLLVQQAYACNMRAMTRPALGRFLYQKYLERPLAMEEEEKRGFCRGLCRVLSPTELVNTLFYALGYRDQDYLASFLRSDRHDVLFSRLEEILPSRSLLVEARAEKATSGDGRAWVNAHTVRIDDEEMYRAEWELCLSQEHDYWQVEGIARRSAELLCQADGEGPLQRKVSCAVYEILDLDAMLSALDKIEELKEVGELPFGVHLRIARTTEDAKQGVFFLTGVQADLVVNGDELVVIAPDEDCGEEIHDLLVDAPGAMNFLYRQQVEIIAAYSYLSGQYLSFDDVLAGEGDESFFEDGLKFLTARYLVKDRERVLGKLRLVQGTSYKFPHDCEVFYELGKEGRRQVITAEYVLGDNWVTVSAYGNKELAIVRESFESGLKDCLEFEGMEVRCEGIFELITSDVKNIYPHLESELKQAYLNKWYGSNLKPLQGMSPRDAALTEEGQRLLWRMFKEMKRKERAHQILGVRKAIELKEYMRKVDLKN